ncbi:MAG: GTPase Era [Bacteroidales bacterium]
MKHKAGFVNIIGNPNVGKSTLMNKLVGEKLSIITSKAQTTRHRIMGIVSGENFQVVYSDTPGIINPHYRLHEKMLKVVDRAIEDGDVLLYITDVKEQYDKHAEYIEKLKNLSIPVIVVINKIDLAKENELLILPPEWKKMLPNAHIIPASALKGYNMPGTFDLILELLPENPPYYPKDALTDKPERFFAGEIIREKIFINYKKEVPYSTEVKIEEFKDEKSILRIRAIIYVLRESQKGIIIGKRGEALKKIGTWARQDMEAVFGKKVFLELFVKITKDWREKENFLRSAGYNT